MRLRELFRSRRLSVEATRVQSIGTRGEDIKHFQQILNRKGRRFNVEVEVTGVYDEQTRAAVTEYQRQSLAIANSDGYVGPQTARRLGIRLVEA